MEWKELIKHIFILFGIILLFGMICSLITELFRLHKDTTYLWIRSVIAIILIPLIYSFFIKKTVKELAIFTIIFVLISSIVFVPLMSITKSVILDFGLRGDSPIVDLVLEVFSMNPITLIYSPICAPYLVVLYSTNNSRPNVEICPLQKYGLFAEIIIVGIIGIIIILISMITGSYLSKLKK